MGHLLANLLRFVRLLRECGVAVPAARTLEVLRALEYIDLGSRADFHHALRCLLVQRAEDLPRFEDAFRLFWRRPPNLPAPPHPRSRGQEIRVGPPEIELPSLTSAADSAPGRSTPLPTVGEVQIRTYSRLEMLRETDFAQLSGAEVAEAEALMTAMRWDRGERRSRRWRTGAGTQLDLGRMQRANARYGGEWLDLPRRRRKLRRRPLVLICDVSGSMERYSRMMLQFGHCLAGSDSGAGVEAFLFATRLTRITRRLGKRSFRQMMASLPGEIRDWSGGTRIGAALHAFNVEWGRRVLNHGPVVLLISDGWDRGEPELLRREIARLQRSCHRLIWLNPLLGSPDYEPLTRGMQAALTFVDDFLPVHNLASLETLAAHLEALPSRRPARHQAPTTTEPLTATRGIFASTRPPAAPC